MIDCKNIFPNCLLEDGRFEIPTYQDIVESIGKIEIQSQDDDYQGSYFFLLKKNHMYGYLSFSYGSCSGCDMLQSCNNYESLQNLVNRLEVSVVWQTSWEDMQKWINERDWETVIDWHTGAKKFLKQFKEYPLRAFR